MTASTWIQADWSAPEGVVAGCSTRDGGVSLGRYASLNLGEHVGDEQDSVRENRRRLASACELPSEPVWLNQVHGKDVVTAPEAGMTADASMTDQRNVVCVVMVADCLPVLFCNDDGSRVAAAHAGWRGLAAGVLENTVDAFDDPPERLQAWLGPAISQPAFEVGDEVREAFLAHDPAAGRHFEQNARRRWQADLYGIARQRLSAAGVRRVTGGDFCTYGDEARFFSHRRDGTCGRMAAFVFRR